MPDSFSVLVGRRNRAVRFGQNFQKIRRFLHDEGRWIALLLGSCKYGCFFNGFLFSSRFAFSGPYPSRRRPKISWKQGSNHRRLRPGRKRGGIG
jgi:hypothetical protein